LQETARRSFAGLSFAGRVRGTPKVLNHSARNQMDF
jgi:hypothetical protein